MKNNKHYIYEIKGIKEGCCKDINNRIKQYNDKYTKDDLIVLEVLENKTNDEVRTKGHEINRKNGTGCRAKIKYKYCDFIGSVLAIGKFHNDKCIFKNADHTASIQMSLFK